MVLFRGTHKARNEEPVSHDDKNRERIERIVKASMLKREQQKAEEDSETVESEHEQEEEPDDDSTSTYGEAGVDEFLAQQLVGRAMRQSTSLGIRERHRRSSLNGSSTGVDHSQQERRRSRRVSSVITRPSNETEASGERRRRRHGRRPSCPGAAAAAPGMESPSSGAHRARRRPSCPDVGATAPSMESSSSGGQRARRNLSRNTATTNNHHHHHPQTRISRSKTLPTELDGDNHNHEEDSKDTTTPQSETQRRCRHSIRRHTSTGEELEKSRPRFPVNHSRMAPRRTKSESA